MIIKLSKHAEEQMIARGISTNEVEKAIKIGAKYLQKPNKIVSESGYYSVVYKKIDKVYYIITVQPRW